MKDKKIFQKMTAIVTGASEGLGRATCIKFAENGIKVCGIARTREKLESLKEKITGSKGVFLPIPADITDYNKIKEVTEGVIDKWDKVDILVNNAGIGKWRVPLEEQTKESIDKVIDTNLKGLIYITKFVVSHMINTKSGYIFNISSTVGLGRGNPGNLIYSSTKNAVTGFSDGLAKYLMPHNIYATTLNPGGMNTPFWQKAGKGEDKGSDKIDPDSIAELMLYILRQPKELLIKQVIMMPTSEIA